MNFLRTHSLKQKVFWLHLTLNTYMLFLQLSFSSFAFSTLGGKCPPNSDVLLFITKIFYLFIYLCIHINTYIIYSKWICAFHFHIKLHHSRLCNPSQVVADGCSTEGGEGVRCAWRVRCPPDRWLYLCAFGWTKTFGGCQMSVLLLLLDVTLFTSAAALRVHTTP